MLVEKDQGYNNADQLQFATSTNVTYVTEWMNKQTKPNQTIDIVAIQNVSTVTKKLLIQTAEINSVCVYNCSKIYIIQNCCRTNIRKNNFCGTKYKEK